MRALSCRKMFVSVLAIVVLSLSLNAHALTQTAPLITHELITQQLITMVEHNAELKKLLIKSIESARIVNPDRRMNPAQTLEEYYLFTDWAAKAMPWSIVQNLPYPMLYDQIDQSLDYFYFINDQPLEELKNRGFFHNSLQYYEPYRTWLIGFVKSWGLHLSRGGSWSDAYYEKALADDRFGLKKGWYEDPSHWKTFNQFFARYLKAPNQRPITAPGDSSVFTSPADSKPQGTWKIDQNSNIVEETGVSIKSNIFKSVAVLIGEDSAYKDAFAGGTLTHTFLDVDDYHRYHFPISGTVKEVRIIEADDAVGGIITWDAKAHKYVLTSTEPGWQNVETRGCVIVETKEYGFVALLPIGMSQISSVNFEEDVKIGKSFNKGDMLGTFLFGGSDIVMLFQNKAGFQLTTPKDAMGGFKHLLMGEEYGRIKSTK
jgi:phosphatidylserine decarboxylase